TRVRGADLRRTHRSGFVRYESSARRSRDAGRAYPERVGLPAGASPDSIATQHRGNVNQAPPARTRAIVAIVAACVSVGLVLVFRLVLGQHTSDLDQLIVGARRVMSGETPYTPSPLPGLEWPIFYPMPAIVLAAPFTGLAPTIAQSIFCGL